jgi:hypothetical protein
MIPKELFFVLMSPVAGSYDSQSCPVVIPEYLQAESFPAFLEN